MTRSRKIIIIINNLGIGGAERLAVDEIKEMLRIGVDVTLITLRPEFPLSFANELTLDKDKRYCVAFRSLVDISSWLKLIRIIKLSQPDLVITQLWFSNTIGRLAAVLAGVRNIISFEQNVYDTVKSFKMFLADWFLQIFSKKIIAVSLAVKRSLVKHHIKESKISIIYNSTDLSVFSQLFNRLELRKTYFLPEEAFVYVFIGRLINQKAVDVLIEAFGLIEDVNSYLLIVGQGKDEAILKLKVKEANLDKRVIFAGVSDNIPAILSMADCFVLPSRYEGLPLVLIEALASGIAIIVSDFESAKEVIIDNRNGLVVPREDPKTLAEAMIRLKVDDELRSRLSLGARETSEIFSIRRHVRDLLCYANI